jgi:hypothetical protein
VQSDLTVSVLCLHSHLEIGNFRLTDAGREVNMSVAIKAWGFLVVLVICLCAQQVQAVTKGAVAKVVSYLIV